MPGARASSWRGSACGGAAASGPVPAPRRGCRARPAPRRGRRGRSTPSLCLHTALREARRASIHSGEFRCLDHGCIVRDSVHAQQYAPNSCTGLDTAAFLCAHRRRRDHRRTRSPPSAPNSPAPPALPAPSPRRRPYAAAPTVWQMACCLVRDVECRYCGGLTVYPRRASSARASWSARSRSSAVCPRRIAAIGAGTGTGGGAAAGAGAAVKRYPG